VKAQLLGEVVAEASDEDLVWIEGRLYFPPDSVKYGALKHSPRPYTCPWKGVAQYFDVVATGSRVPAAAWSYPMPLPSAVSRVGADFSDYVAFDPAFVDVG
jgi:uncharacterized protein (DUF427 family)